MPLNELIRKFSLKRASRSAAVFDFEKLNWVNREHMKGLKGEKALEASRPFIQESGLPLDERDPIWWQEAIEAVWGEVDSLAQVPERLKVFFDPDFHLAPGETFICPCGLPLPVKPGAWSWRRYSSFWAKIRFPSGCARFGSGRYERGRGR